MKPIIIPCHWHTASSMISEALIKSGMIPGNKNTYWNDVCIANYEHYLMNNTMASVLSREYDNLEENINTVKKILKAYKDEAKKNKWEFYGFKTTHLLQSWEVFGKTIQDCLPNAIYVIGISHPAMIAKTLAGKPHGSEYAKKELLDYVSWSWLKAYEGIKSILKTSNKVYTLDYPDSWKKNKVESIVKQIGLKPDFGNIFDRKRIKELPEKNEFETKYPEATKAYYELKKLSGKSIKTNSKGRGRPRTSNLSDSTKSAV